MLVKRGWGDSLEVLNAGIPNSGIGDQAIWYDRWVSDFHPELVILRRWRHRAVSKRAFNQWY